MDKIINIDTKAFLRCAKITGGDKSRRMYQYIYVQNGLYVATDGLRMILHKSIFNGIGSHGLLIRPDKALVSAVAKIVKLKNNKVSVEKIELNLSNGIMCGVVADFTIHGDEFTFPNYKTAVNEALLKKEVLLTDYETGIHFNPQLFTDFSYDEESPHVSFKYTGATSPIFVSHTLGDYIGVVMPMRADEKSVISHGQDFFDYIKGIK